MTRNQAPPPRPFVRSLTPLRPDRKIVLVDMDGTLSDCSHREHHIQTARPNWPAFFRGMGQDPPNASIVELTRSLAADHDILIVTGRPQEFLHETLNWLTRNGISPAEIWMRRAEDHRPDFVVKREVLDHIPRDRVVFVLDDRERVCDMWDSEGLVCHRVKQGECELTRKN